MAQPIRLGGGKLILPPLPPLLITLGVSLFLIALGIWWAILRQSRASGAMLKEQSQEYTDNRGADLAPSVYPLRADAYSTALSEVQLRDPTLSRR